MCLLRGTSWICLYNLDQFRPEACHTTAQFHCAQSAADLPAPKAVRPVAVTRTAQLVPAAATTRPDSDNSRTGLIRMLLSTERYWLKGICALGGKVICRTSGINGF